MCIKKQKKTDKVSIVDTAGTVYDLVKKGATIELQEQLMKLRAEALASQEEVLKLRQRVTELEAAAAQAAKMFFEGGVYWLTLDDGDTDGPFCQRCFDEHKRTVRLQYFEATYKDFGTTRKWECRS